MTDLKHLVTDRTGRRVTDTSSMWAFACGFLWAMGIFMFVSAI
jgi:hypothetical protein